MMRAFPLAMLGLWAAATAADGPTPVAAPAPQPWSRYQVLVERNPFVAERQRAATGGEAARGDAAPAPAESAGSENPDRLLVLVGVVIGQEGPVAVLEDSLTGEIRRCAAGTALRRGRIVDIDWRSLGYELGGEVRRVAVGEALAGGGTRRAPAAKAAGSTAPPAAGEKAAGNSVLERLRAQRRRETGQ